MSNEVKRYKHEPSQYARMFIDTLPPGEYVPAIDYAALEAECERLNRESQNLSYQLGRCDRERRSLAAELAAIRAAGGEQVEVVAITLLDRELGEDLTNDQRYLDLWRDSQGKNVWLKNPLMTVAQHQRIVAAMAAELERARQSNIEAKKAYFANRRASNFAASSRLEGLEAARKQEPVFWRCFDGEGGYDYTEDEETAMRWKASLGEKYADWLVPLYVLPPLAGQVSVPRELLERCIERWACCAMAQTPGAEQAWSELRALLATPSMEVKHET